MSQSIENEIMEVVNKNEELFLRLKCLNEQIRDVSGIELEILTEEIIQLELIIFSNETRYNNLLQLRSHQLYCEHSFVEDLIDIDLERSKNIRYCSVCMFTCEN